MAWLSRTARQGQSSAPVNREELLRPWPKISFKAIGIILLIVAAFYWSLQGTRAAPAELIDGIPNIVNFVKRMFPPQFETQTETLQTPEIALPFGITIPRIGFAGITFPYPIILNAIVETIQIAIIGTALAIVISAPFAVLAARNIAPPLVYATTRFGLNVNRAIPDLIFALIFVAAVGLGPFGGVLALAVGSIGFMAKVYAESIEAIDPQQVLAVRATGAGRLQTIVYAVAPQALPMIASYSLLLFETNVRAATILGIVGAGGVGFELNKYMALFQYQLLTGALIIIIIVVTVLDRVSDRIRRRIT
ncbi:MAG: phosphonate ABC transporter, permease protein PhnE [Dehalococcoidia bacterium]